MAEQENRVSIRFTNALFIEIFGRYASNSEMAEFIAPDGSVELDCLMVNGVIDPPKSCEQMLSLMYALFETNPKYCNVRSGPGTEYTIVGRMYDGSVGSLR